MDRYPQSSEVEAEYKTKYSTALPPVLSRIRIPHGRECDEIYKAEIHHPSPREVQSLHEVEPQLQSPDP